MANVFFFSDLRPQAPFSSLTAAVEAALKTWKRGEDDPELVRDNNFDVAFTAIFLKLVSD